MSKVTVSFTLDSDKDRRILRYLEGLPRGAKSAAIRAALDAHLGDGDITVGDVYRAVKDLQRKMATGLILAQAGNRGDALSGAADEPADVAANLESLGL